MGPTHVSSLNCLNQLAVTLQKADGGKAKEEAQEMHRQTLMRRRQVLGDAHEDTLQSASNLAVLLSERQADETTGKLAPLSETKFAEAKDLYALAVSGREKTIGPDHPRTLYTVSNFGRLLSEAPKLTPILLEEADGLHRRAVGKLTEKLHETHPLTLTAMHNQGYHLGETAKFLAKREETT